MVRVADQEAVSGGACGDAVYERPVDIRSNSAERGLPGVAEVTRDRDQPDRTEKDKAEDGGKKPPSELQPGPRGMGGLLSAEGECGGPPRNSVNPPGWFHQSILRHGPQDPRALRREADHHRRALARNALPDRELAAVVVLHHAAHEGEPEAPSA